MNPNLSALQLALSLFLPRLPSALLITVEVTVSAGAIGLSLGLVLALFRLSPSRILSSAARLVIDIVRVIPIPPFLYLVYFGFLVTPTKLSPEMAGTIALGVLLAPYMAELYRSGIQSVDTGKVEAGLALGMSPWLIRTRIVFPVAIRVMLPAIGQTLVGTLLDSSFVAVLGGTDVTGIGRRMVNTFFATYLWFVIAAIYFILSFPISRAFSYVERRMSTYL
jgi:polar amino acid transport system permease protein